MLRWLLRIFLTLLALLVVVIVVVQIVLSTNFPKRLVLSEVQKQLGLRVAADDVSTGWFGETTLTNVTAGLPLESESFLTMPKLEVRHTWLPVLLATQKLELKSLELNDAKLVVRQDPKTGRWNLQDVLELLARTGGKEQAKDLSASKNRPKLPKVIVGKATLVLTDRNGKGATLEPVAFAGTPDETAPSLVYHYDLKAANLLNAKGKLLPGGKWQHVVDFNLTDDGKLLAPWLGASRPIAISGQWSGEQNNGAVNGRLTLTKAGVESYGATGIVLADIGPGSSAVIRPQGLVITTPQKALPEASIVGGQIRYDGNTLTAEKLNIQALGGVAEVGGAYTLASNVGDITANWYDLGPVDAGVRQSGSFKASLKNPFPGNPEVTATLTSNGVVENIGKWDTELTINGNGARWNETNWKLAFSKLNWEGKFRPINLKQLTADIQVRDQSITLTQMHLAEGGEVKGTGSLDLLSAEKKWNLELTGNGWPLPRMTQSLFEFKARADGTLKPAYIDIEQIYARSGDTELTAHGTFDAQRPKPVAMKVTFTNRPELQIADEQDVIRGHLTGEGTVEGTLASSANTPARLDLAFKLHGQELAFRDRQLGDMDIEITGEADSEQATIRSQELDLLGGRWSLGGIWKRHNEEIPQEDVIRIQVGVHDLPLGQVGEAASGRTDIGGIAQGDFSITVPAMQRPRLTGKGTFSATGVRVGDALSAESAKGVCTLSGDQLQITSLDLVNNEGKATVDATVSLRKLKQPTVGVKATQWVLKVPGSQTSLKVNADTRLALDLQAFTATGPVKADSTITYDNQEVGQAKIDAEIVQKTLKLNTIDATAFGGEVKGSATLSADAPLTSAATLTWRRIDGPSLAKLQPQLEGLTGKFGGTLKIAPSKDPRALGELRGDLVLDSYEGQFRGAMVGDATITGYLGSDGKSPDGKPKYRFVLSDTDEDPSLIRLADGVVRVWGRVSKHDADNTSAQLALSLDRLDVDQLAHAANPKIDKEHRARLNGKMTFVGPINDPKRVFGTGSLDIVESDLVNVPFIKELYNALRIGIGARKPNGYGSLDLQLDASRLDLTNVRYFNRGTEVRAELRVKDIWAGNTSPIEGSAIGTLRPLKDLKLPFLADVDDVLNALQAQLGVQSVLIAGTVAEQKVRPVLFSELGAGFRGVLMGEVQSRSGND